MAANTAEITWVSKDEALVRTLEKTERGFDQLLRKMDRVEKASVQAGQSVGREFDAATATLKNFAMGMAGVGGLVAGIQIAARTLKQEYDQMVQRQKAALEANQSLADVLPNTFRQFGGLLSAKEVQSAVSRVSGATGVDQVRVAQAIGEAGAARGATTKAEAMQAIAAAEAALRFAPEADPQTIAALAGGTTDLQRRFGVSAEQSIGFLARVGGQARVTSLREQVQNLNPAIGALTQFGMAPNAAGGLVSVLTGATGDFTGAMSRTASVQLVKQLQDRGFATPEQGIAALQADPKLREAFFKGGRFGGKQFEKAAFEAATYASIRELLTGGSALAQNYAAATREVGTFAQGGETYADMVGQVGALRPVQIAGAVRAGTASLGRGQAEQQFNARVAAARKIQEEALGAVNFAGFDLPIRYTATAGFESDVLRGVPPELRAARTLRNLAEGAARPADRGERDLLLRQAEILERMYAEISGMRRDNQDKPQVKAPPSGNLAR